MGKPGILHVETVDNRLHTHGASRIARDPFWLTVYDRRGEVEAYYPREQIRSVKWGRRPA